MPAFGARLAELKARASVLESGDQSPFGNYGATHGMNKGGMNKVGFDFLEKKCNRGTSAGTGRSRK